MPSDAQREVQRLIQRWRQREADDLAGAEAIRDSTAAGSCRADARVPVEDFQSSHNAAAFAVR